MNSGYKPVARNVDTFNYFDGSFLFRISCELIITCIVNQEFKRSNMNSFKRTVRYMLYCIVFGEILDYLLRIYEFNTKSNYAYHAFAHKLLVDLVHATFNCSVCYAMAMYLKMKQSMLLRIWYSSIGIVLIYLTIHTFFKDRFGGLEHNLIYLMFGIISSYTLKLLHQIRNKDAKLFDNDQKVPSFVFRLIYLEWFIMILSFTVYVISVCRAQFRTKGVVNKLSLYILDEFRSTVSFAFLIKMYTFIIEWGPRGNKVDSSSKTVRVFTA